MKLRINLKQSLAAAALLSTAAFTVACSRSAKSTFSRKRIHVPRQ